MSISPEQAKPIIPFEDFLRLPDEDVYVGMRVGPLPPAKLYASQDWIDDRKLRAALKALAHPDPLLIPLYVHRARFANGGTHRITVIADYHHRALVWATHGLRIYGTIEATSLPERLKPQSIIPFSVFRRQYESEVLTF